MLSTKRAYANRLHAAHSTKILHLHSGKVLQRIAYIGCTEPEELL